MEMSKGENWHMCTHEEGYTVYAQKKSFSDPPGPNGIVGH